MSARSVPSHSLSSFSNSEYKNSWREQGYYICECQSQSDLLGLIEQVGIPDGHDAQGRILWDIKPDLSGAARANSRLSL